MKKKVKKLHSICNASLRLKKRMSDEVRLRMRVPIQSTVTIKLLANAEDFDQLVRATFDDAVELSEYVSAFVPEPDQLPFIRLDDIPLPQRIERHINSLIEREKPSDRVVVRSKSRYLTWVLRFRTLVAAFECGAACAVNATADPGNQFRPAVTKPPPIQEPPRPAGEAVLPAAPAFDRAPHGSGPTKRAAELLENDGAAAGAANDYTSGVPPVPPQLAPGVETGRGQDVGNGDGDLGSAGAAAAAQLAYGVPAPIEGAVRRAGRLREGTQRFAHREASADEERAEHGSADISMLKEPSTEDARDLEMPATANPPADQGDEQRTDLPGDGAKGRILLDAPAGQGLTRVEDGTKFTYSPAEAAWFDETIAEKKVRILAVIKDLLAGEPVTATEPWQDYLPVPASMPISRRLATTILGSYEDVTGRTIAPLEFEFERAPRVRRLGSRKLLTDLMNPHWKRSAWSAKVLAGEGPTEGSGERTWPPVRQEFDAEASAWIRVHASHSAAPLGSSETTDEALKAEDEVEEAVDDLTGDPPSRYADAVERFAYKPAPSIDDRRWNQPHPPLLQGLKSGRYFTVLGPGGVGKTYNKNRFAVWVREMYGSKVSTFEFKAEEHGRNRKRLEELLERMEDAEADGYMCILIVDEAQHLTASVLQALPPCSQLMLLGDVRQAGSEMRVHPMVGFSRALGANVITLDRVWRSSNSSLFNALSFVFYDGAFSALGRGDGRVDPPLFRFEICHDDPEIIAAHIWAMARHFEQRERRSLMIAVERQDVRDAVIQIAGRDPRQWAKGAGTVQLTRLSEVQGKEADVVLVLPHEIGSIHEDPGAAARAFITVMGRAREELWCLFARKPDVSRPAQRLVASLLRSFMESTVTAALPPPLERTHANHSFIDATARLGLAAHDLGERLALLAYRDRVVAVGSWSTPQATLGEQDASKLVDAKGWPRFWFDKPKQKLTCTAKNADGQYLHGEKAEAEISKRMARIDAELDGTGPKAA